MTNYDFTEILSPIDFELLTKDLLEADLGMHFENFKEGKDHGIDLRHAKHSEEFTTIVQCKRYGANQYSNLKSSLKNQELTKIQKLKPKRYILSTSVSLSVAQVDELVEILSPFVQSSADIYGRDRLNSLLQKHSEVERRHNKLWIGSSGVLETVLHADIHRVSSDELSSAQRSARIYVKNPSLDDALKILKKHHVCIISGIPGIGKTTLARMLMLYFLKHDFELIKIEENIKEAHKIPYGNKPRFFYYDDFLGQTGLADKLGKNEDQQILDFMRTISEGKSSVLILTTREYILNQAKLTYEKIGRAKFDHNTCIVDLSKYSRRIRAEILYNHLYFSQIPVEYIRSILGSNRYLKIIDHENYNPRIIEQLTSPEWYENLQSGEYATAFLETLKKPDLLWRHAYENQISSRAQNLLLCLTTLPVEVEMNDLQNAFSQLHKEKCRNYCVALKSNDFMQSLRELEGSFIRIGRLGDSNFIAFQNPSIRDFMQNQLLVNEDIGMVIESSIFFEQVSWFSGILRKGQNDLPTEQLVLQQESLIKTLKSLFETPPVKMRRSYNFKDYFSSSKRPAEELERVATITSLRHYLNKSSDDGFIQNKLRIIKDELGKCDYISYPHSTIGSLDKIDSVGYLENKAGQEIIALIKSTLLKHISELEDFEAIEIFQSRFPDHIEIAEVQSLRTACEIAIDIKVAELVEENDDPDDIREYADQIERVGGTFGVETSTFDEKLRVHAQEIVDRNDTAEEWDHQELSNDINETPEEISDEEISSMFNTLTS